MFFIFPPAITELLDRANDLYQKRCNINEFYEAALKEKDMSEDMVIMNLRDIIKGLYDNIVPVSVLEEHLPAVDKKNEEFLKRVQNILDTGEDYKLDIFEEAFCKRQDLFEELKTYGRNEK